MELKSPISTPTPTASECLNRNKSSNNNSHHTIPFPPIPPSPFPPLPQTSSYHHKSINTTSPKNSKAWQPPPSQSFHLKLLPISIPPLLTQSFPQLRPPPQSQRRPPRTPRISKNAYKAKAQRLRGVLSVLLYPFFVTRVFHWDVCLFEKES
jgi:hypothetical protein